MKRIILIGLLCGIFFVVGGCVPKRVVWSLDGKKAMVLGEDGVYLTDADGHFVRALAYTKTQSQPTTASAAMKPTAAAKFIDSVEQAAWLPDSRHAIFLTKITVHSLSEVSFIPENGWKKMAERLAAFEKEIQSTTNLKKTLDEVTKGLYEPEGKLLKFYITQNISPEGKAKIGSAWNEFKVDTMDVTALDRYTLSNDSFPSSVVLTYTFENILEIRPSPDGKFVAYVVKVDNDRQCLKVVPSDGSAEPVLIENNVNWYPDWSPDSRSLVYVKKAGNAPSIAFGILSRRQIVDEKGRWKTDSKPEDLVGLLFDGGAKVRCLPDGRILFGSMPLKLPCTASQMPKKPTLFVLDSARYPGVIPIVPAQAECPMDGLMWYEPSPDGRYVSIPSRDGAVAVLEIRTGEVTDVQPIGEEGGKKDDIKLRTVPVWRNNHELCFAVPAGSPMGSPKRAEIVLYSMKDKKSRCISRDWPDSAVKNFLAKK